MAEGVNFQINNEFCNRIYGGLFINIGLLHLISVPDPPATGEDLPFLLTPEDWLKLPSPPKTSIKCVLTPDEYGFTPVEFREN